MKINKMTRDITIKLLDENGKGINSEQVRMGDEDFNKRLTILDERCLEVIRNYVHQAESDSMEKYKIEIGVRKK